MPKVNFADVPDPDSRDPVPADKYLCVLEQVLTTKKDGELRRSTGGHEQWGLGFKIIDGKHAGRMLWDNMTFSPEGIKRAKLICSRLGLDVNAIVDLTPAHMLRRPVKVTAIQAVYNGQMGNKVPFEGYERVTEEEAALARQAMASATGTTASSQVEEPEDDMPF